MAENKKRGFSLDIIHATGKNNKPYFALVLDMGYTKKYLAFGAMCCAEIYGVYPNELASLCPLNSSLHVGDI